MHNVTVITGKKKFLYKKQILILKVAIMGLLDYRKKGIRPFEIQLAIVSVTGLKWEGTIQLVM